jgi:hypothetical protein
MPRLSAFMVMRHALVRRNTLLCWRKGQSMTKRSEGEKYTDPELRDQGRDQSVRQGRQEGPVERAQVPIADLGVREARRRLQGREG